MEENKELEGLKSLCTSLQNQLESQRKEFINRIRVMDMSNAFKRMDYLFKVLEFKSVFSEEIIERVSTEIADAIYPNEENPEEEKKIVKDDEA